MGHTPSLISCCQQVSFPHLYDDADLFGGDSDDEDSREVDELEGKQ